MNKRTQVREKSEVKGSVWIENGTVVTYETSVSIEYSK